MLQEVIAVPESKITDLILKEYGNLPSMHVMDSTFFEVCKLGYTETIGLFIDASMDDDPCDLHDRYVTAFNEGCMRGNYAVVEYLMSRCQEYLRFDDDFTFDKKDVEKHKDIIKLLFHTYGETVLCYIYGNRLATEFSTLIQDLQ